jgi:two-component system, cell cycle sensor histidine kinase and response regulator CckA
MTTTAARTSRWVTSRVREALAAGSNTELLKALVEAFPGSWFFTRLDATFAFVNQHACDVLGYTRDELMALTLYDVDPGLTPAIWNELLAMGNFTPASVRTVHRRKDGSTFPVEAFGSRIVLGDENVSVSYIVDLSEEAETRQALAEKQHLLQSLLDNAPVIVWSVGSNGRFQLSEGSALSLLGLEPGQIVGRTMAEQFPALPDIVEATERTLHGESVEGVVSLEKHDFEYRYLPQRDEKGDVIGATGVAIDVTARRQAEHSNRRLMTAIEQTDASILLLDPKGTIEYANKAFESIWHMSKRDAAGRSWPDLLPEDESARPELACAIADGIAWRGTIRLERPEGAECIAQATLSPMLDAQDRLTGFVAVLRDVTLQTRTEERLRQVEKMDAVGQLAGGVAHDFNNLLQVIMGNVDLCMTAGSPEQARASLAEIREAGKRAAGLVSQLLTFSRNVGTPTSVDLVELIVRLMPILRRLLGEHILVELQKDQDSLEVWGDGSQLEQIIVNLCVNARDAMPEGGRLDLRLFARPILSKQAVHLGLSGPGRYVVIEVRDTGCGMTDEVQRRAFEPFFTTKAPGVGTGLGLATVYGVAKRHGGSVELESSPGSGSCFRVFLRAAEPTAKAAQQPVQPHAKAARPLRILLAEDDASVREVTRRFLVQAGHEVTVASTGTEAIRLFERKSARFELLILDAIMPGANGPEVLRRFRSSSAAPVLFVTGHDFDVLSGVPMDGTWSVLRKPFNADDLASAISKLGV